MKSTNLDTRRKKRGEGREGREGRGVEQNDHGREATGGAAGVRTGGGSGSDNDNDNDAVRPRDRDRDRESPSQSGAEYGTRVQSPGTGYDGTGVTSILRMGTAGGFLGSLPPAEGGPSSSPEPYLEHGADKSTRPADVDCCKTSKRLDEPPEKTTTQQQFESFGSLDLWLLGNIGRSHQIDLLLLKAQSLLALFPKTGHLLCFALLQM
ncbi:hypothetical protein AXG93_1433s1400 [Marchantia polymorpha subsp. ruderalis]|uniref:Uncharacterized protein n=1 Tax=Marchantia polymorpha subsp. ruderalis TaxID=1480154 RepID=A0A176W8V0_MARPO|nr:hypothetical protein AXG93_1433s1400 [Marchantia polymorpha subsp. ruderalis]